MQFYLNKASPRQDYGAFNLIWNKQRKERPTMPKEELQLADFVTGLKYEDIPPDSLAMVKKVLLTVSGTIVGGHHSEGMAELAAFFGDMGGKPEATILIYNHKIPTQTAALVNAAMARALDYCDSINPGPHFGAALISVGLALTELKGSSGQDFLTAFAVGLETGSRFNLPEKAYGGADPTGLAGAFATTAMACRMLGLTREQTLNALGIALNNASGSFQSNIDGSLSVRLNQGMIAHDGILAARLAQKGLTGPVNFLGGVYGYCNLQGRGMITPDYITDTIGKTWKLNNTVFKKYPSCFQTASATEATLQLMGETGLTAQDVAAVELKIQPFGYNLVGKCFNPGPTPKVDGQFSVAYCIANALLRGESRLNCFEPNMVTAPEIAELTKKITIISDAEIYRRGHSAIELKIMTTDGREMVKQLDEAPGTPHFPLTEADHLQHLGDCLTFGGRPGVIANQAALIETVNNFETKSDALDLLNLLNN